MNSKGKLASCGRGETSRRNRQIRCLSFQTMDFIGHIHLCVLCLKPSKADEVQRAQGAEAQTLLSVPVSPMLSRIQWFPWAGQPGCTFLGARGQSGEQLLGNGRCWFSKRSSPTCAEHLIQLFAGELSKPLLICFPKDHPPSSPSGSWAVVVQPWRGAAQCA